MSFCQSFFLLFTPQLGKWLLLRTAEQYRLLSSSEMKVTGCSGFWKVDWALYLHSLPSLAISRSFSMWFFTHSSQFGLYLFELAFSLFTKLTLLLSSNFKSSKVSSLLQAASFIVSCRSRTWFLAFFGAEILSELYLTFNIYTVNIQTSKNAKKWTLLQSIV